MTEMRDLAFLREPIATPPKALDSVDPALATLASLAEKEQLDELAARVDALFDEGIYDVRAISYYLWVVWKRKGLLALAEIFDTLSALVSTNLSAMGPVEKRDAHLAKRIAWMTQKVGDDIQYNEAKRTPEWRAWSKTVEIEEIDATLLAVQRLDSALGDSFATARQALIALAPRLQSLREAFARPVDDEVPASLRHPLAGEAEALAPRADSMRVVVRSGRAEIGVSTAYFELIEKLEAFQRLIDKQDLVKASIVADDVMHIIESFDPRTYFPEMFADFSERLSQNVEKLSSFWGQRDSITWKAMVQFYRVDLRRFVGG